MAKPEITIILPNMAALIQQEINKTVFPLTLQNIFKKGRFTSDTSSLERCLISHFSSENLIGTDLPVAGLRSEQAYVLCADPCYLHPDRDRLLLFSDSLQISEAEAEEYIAAIQPLLTDFGAVLKRDTSEKWFIQLESMPELNFTALADVNGKAVHDHLPSGKEADRLAWLRLWNEIQMLLFDLPLNEQRQQQGKMAINSLWFWGRGELNVETGRWQNTAGESELLQQLSKLANVNHSNHIDSSVISAKTGKQLVVFNPLDLEGDWLKQLSEVEPFLIKVWQALKWNKLSNVNLEIPNYGTYQLSAFDCWKPW